MSVLQTDAFPFRQVAMAAPNGSSNNAPLLGAFCEERVKGLEPSTFCMASRRSSQLSYTREARAH